MDVPTANDASYERNPSTSTIAEIVARVNERKECSCQEMSQVEVIAIQLDILFGKCARCNSSSTEAGVLVANHLATARPLPKEVRTIRGGGTNSPTITVPPREVSSCLFIVATTHPCTRSASSGEYKMVWD
ncbi:hypothetical protein AVEN_16854-1 [Araneus ventricosus]|uniref:Uncharacterized protein n=1 Tax=Araneus ventricosus TaxID=182803 RepID=A0A4Y2KZ66_ARAVE|nr:hypothetical protein AVEN_16854-1 [Araneus ventricosus]